MELKKAEQLAIEKIKQYCPEYTFKWDNARSRFGYCSWKKKDISLSKGLILLNTEEQVLNTILHEIAHALTPHQYHNRVWKKMAISIGCSGDRCYESSKVISPPKPYKGTCLNCGDEITAYKRTKGACKDCCIKYNFGRFDKKYLFTWTKN